MNSTDSSLKFPAAGTPSSLLARMVCSAIRARLRPLRKGSIVIVLPGGNIVHHNGDVAGPCAELSVLRWRAIWRILTDGELGLARAHIDGDCASPDIKALIAFGAVNGGALAQAMPNTWLSRTLDRFRHWRRANTRRGSRRNIAAHYDLGNDFYARWLDSGMQYSSAIYGSSGETLEFAQATKLRHIAALLEVEAGHHVLEIGCGWGALAEHLVRHHGCAVTGLTLSAEQKIYAETRLGAAAEFWLQDYRDVQGRYERIASIEMLEAVGERYWQVYFQKLRQSLTETGVAVLQVITIAEDKFAAYKRQPDFIQRYVFPGGMLPTVDAIRRQAERAGLQLVAHETFGQSYALTLAEWRRRFARAWPAINALGFDTRFRRMWEYYLAYCEVGFDLGAINVGLFKLTPTVNAAQQKL